MFLRANDLATTNLTFDSLPLLRRQFLNNDSFNVVLFRLFQDTTDRYISNKERKNLISILKEIQKSEEAKEHIEHVRPWPLT